MHRFASALILTCTGAIVLFASGAADAATRGYSQLHVFNGPNDAVPEGPLIADTSGNLYGTANGTSHNGAGEVFKISTSGVETVLYSFCSFGNCTDGTRPANSGLIVDNDGTMIGTTSLGGNTGNGTVFVLPASGGEEVVYSFCSQTNCADGNSPMTGVIMDKNLNLYGTTASGGANNAGVVFKIEPYFGGESVLYSFCSQANCADGSGPAGGLVRDAAGNFYGVTSTGGAFNYGTVFEIAPNGSETVLYSFCAQASCTDGYQPEGTLVRDSAGNLYGTTFSGGLNSGGTVFEVAPNGVETVLYSFCSATNCIDGEGPEAGIVRYGTTAYGTTFTGGAYGRGTVFSLRGGTFKVLHSFDDNDGAYPEAGVVRFNGYLYGTTYYGGYGSGVLFQLGTGGD